MLHSWLTLARDSASSSFFFLFSFDRSPRIRVASPPKAAIYSLSPVLALATSSFALASSSRFALASSRSLRIFANPIVIIIPRTLN